MIRYILSTRLTKYRKPTHLANRFTLPSLNASHAYPSHLLRNSSTQDLCPEETSLGALNNLLVYAAWWVVHNHCAFLVINLRIDPRVSDQVDNPLLTLVLGKSETG